MADVLAAVDSTTGAFGALVQARLHADMQTAIDSGVTTTIAAMGDVTTAVANKVTQTILAPVYGTVLSAPSNGTTDATSALTSWASSIAGKYAIMPPGIYSTTATLTIPASTTVYAYGAVLYGASGNFPMVTLAAGSRLLGLEVNGNSATRTGGDGVTVTGVAGVTIRDCTIHDIDGKGISIVSGSSYYLIAGNTVANCGGQGISIDGSSWGRIHHNRVTGCQHGIQWWGGDSATGNTIGVAHIDIVGNQISGVAGGIWGSLGQFITVTGNDIASCTDVGIDFEGCYDSTATGNTVSECTNASLAVFYGAQRCTFTGNTCVNSNTNGAGFYAYTAETSAYITVTGNTFSTVANTIATDSNALTDSLFDGNTVYSSSAYPARFQQCGNISFINNQCRCAASIGVSWEGCGDGRIEGNQILTTVDSSAVSADSGGIFLYWTSATYPGKRNRVKDNTIRGFVKGIYDDCWGDIASYTLIENNIATAVYRRSGSSYTGVINNNRNESYHTASTLGTV